jgi:hypothetical protein
MKVTNESCQALLPHGVVRAPVLLREMLPQIRSLDRKTGFAVMWHTATSATDSRRARVRDADFTSTWFTWLTEPTPDQNP